MKKKSMILRAAGAEYPALKLDRQVYNKCWFENLAFFLKSQLLNNVPFSKETLTTYYARKAPSLLYDRFLGDQKKIKEKADFTPSPLLTPTARARQARENLFEVLFKRIERKRYSRPEFLQSIWREAVGSSLAVYSQLVAIDEEKHIGFFRCVSSVIAYEIRKDTTVAEKLTSLSGISIKLLKQVY
ncbi:hypothetical protein EM20IM_00140 [Candidatus Methylacidiphilum infernorum]|uniref:Uncharacterized protein n=1 Tax=Candidatus Methylacidiphilum infernorum TaxID=511746 RepID=A0ABX7PVZ2_9BACT|nr:hypothetical protein [Candidatus Methylacidiphilum infernorum]QSR86821.1 hypothetical protein EM20IM_00140 [Candidatus Methylacidiphilum infernorum]